MRPPANIDALRAHVDGLQALAAGNWNESVQRFKAAVVADSLYADAWFQLATSLASQLDPLVARGALERAAQFRSQLRPRDREVVDAEFAFDSGAVYRGLALGATLIRRNPNDYAGWAARGFVIGHNNAMLGVSMAEARAPLDRALALRPNFAPWAVVRMAVELVLRDRAAYDSLSRRFATVITKHEMVWSVLAGGHFLDAERGDQDQVLGEALLRDDYSVAGAAWNIAVVDLEGAIRMGRVLTDPSRSRDARTLGLTTIAHLQAALG